MRSNRTLILLCVLLGVAVVAIGAWAASSRVVSPAEAAARTAPPTPSPILVPIESRVLSSRIVTRGTARFGLPQPIAIAPSALKTNLAGIITVLPARNTQLKEGDVMFSASGRPVFILQGEIPAYRDLGPGLTGKDVKQLEQSLARLGFEPGPQDGIFDDQTAAAVAKWYDAAGFEPFWPTAEQHAAIQALELALAEATKVKMMATNAAATAKLAVEAARSKAQHADKAANADIQAGIAERELVGLDPRKPATARMAAEAKIEVGRAALKAAQLEGELNYKTAIESQKMAEYDATFTASRADRLATELDRAQRKQGVQVPIDEIVFLPTLPARVQEVTARVGSAANGPVLSVTDNQITIDSSLPLDAASLVKPGMRVDIDEQALGIKTTGVVERVEQSPGTFGVDGFHIYFAVRVAPTQTALDGVSLRLTIPLKSTQGDVSTVPMSALSKSADGTSKIQVQRDGRLQYVVVEPGLVADGFVEVKAVNGSLSPGELVVVGSDVKTSADARP